MKIAKWIATVAAGLVVLIALLLLAVALLVDPNRFKPRIVAVVKSSTHRDLQLQGDIKLSVFPWIALQLGSATLGSPQGFQNAPFLSFKSATIRVKLLPLLRKQLQVDTVILDGVDLNLVKNAAGKGNWQMESEQSSAASPQPDSGSAGGGAAVRSIAGLKVTHGHVVYAPYDVQNFELETGAIAPDQDVSIRFGMDANRGVAGEKLTVAAKLVLRDEPGHQDIQVSALDLSGALTRTRQSSPLPYEFSIPKLDTNLDQQTLTAPAFSAMLAGAKLTGSLSGRKIIDAPSLAGSVELSAVALREFAPQFGIELPKTRDAKALTSLGLSAGFSYNAQQIALENVEIKLDDTTLTGSLTLPSGQSQPITFKLAADRIDLDRYRSPEGATPDPKSAAADTPAPKSADSGEPMNASGVFTLGSVHVAGVDLTQLSMTLAMKDNVMQLNPIDAQIYGGHFAGNVTDDARTATPALSLDEHLSEVDVAQLVAATHMKGRLSGKATVNIKATARGDDADAIEKTLNGHFDANVSTGAIEGVDVGYELALAQSLLNKQTAISVQNTKKTSFDIFKVSAQITNGTAQTQDLTISSAVLKISGQGTVNLPTSGIDMTLLASVMKSATTTAVDIPLKLTGVYTSPTVRPDLEGVAKGAIQQKLNDVLKKNGLDLKNLFKR